MKTFYLSGNNDGDYIRIKQYKKQEKEYTCFVEIGHCCVVIARHQIPTEMITNLFSNALHSSNGDMSEAVRRTLSLFNQDFIEERVSKVQDWR